MNALKEFQNHTSMVSSPVIDFYIVYTPSSGWTEADKVIIQYPDVEKLNFTYDNGYGMQHISGYIWYEDGSWSERGSYDGAGWWEHMVCPPRPKKGIVPHIVEIDYTNWKGERGLRSIEPIALEFTSNQWHPTPCWMIRARDVTKKEVRTFPLSQIHSWKPQQAEQRAQP